MELSGEHRIPAPRATVWEALHDPDVLKDCIRGCERLEKVDDRRMSATVQAKVGPVKATFEGDIAIVEEEEPVRYVMEGEGKGGVAGFAKGSAEVNLAEDGEDTILTYHAKAKVGGKLAQLGSRLIDSTAKKYASDFFEILSEKVAGTPEPAVAAPAAAPPPATGRHEPTLAQVDEGTTEAEIARRNTAVDSPHAEDNLERQLEVEAARRTWGGPWFWGILAFAAVILLLIALQ